MGPFKVLISYLKPCKSRPSYKAVITITDRFGTYIDVVPTYSDARRYVADYYKDLTLWHKFLGLSRPKSQPLPRLATVAAPGSKTSITISTPSPELLTG